MNALHPGNAGERYPTLCARLAGVTLRETRLAGGGTARLELGGPRRGRRHKLKVTQADLPHRARRPPLRPVATPRGQIQSYARLAAASASELLLARRLPRRPANCPSPCSTSMTTPTSSSTRVSNSSTEDARRGMSRGTNWSGPCRCRAGWPGCSRPSPGSTTLRRSSWSCCSPPPRCTRPAR
jgi:hypothetical protein